MVRKRLATPRDDYQGAIQTIRSLVSDLEAPLKEKGIVGIGMPGALYQSDSGRYHERLGRALGGVINILDPQVIVLGGGMSNIDSLYTEVPRLWERYVFSDRVATRLERPVFGDSSGVRGAAWLWN